MTTSPIKQQALGSEPHPQEQPIHTVINDNRWRADVRVGNPDDPYAPEYSVRRYSTSNRYYDEFVTVTSDKISDFLKRSELDPTNFSSALVLGCATGFEVDIVLGTFPNSGITAVDYYDYLHPRMKENYRVGFHQGLIHIYLGLAAKHELKFDIIVINHLGTDLQPEDIELLAKIANQKTLVIIGGDVYVRKPNSYEASHVVDFAGFNEFFEKHQCSPVENPKTIGNLAFYNARLYEYE